ncbi:MAG: LCP family protein, partial [Dehalococcoidia bacterium]
RLRKGLPNGDFDRQRHQQELIEEMLKKATSRGIVTDLPRLNRLIEAGGKTMVLDTGGASLTDFLFTLKDIGADDLVMIPANGHGYESATINGVHYKLPSDDALALMQSVQDAKVPEFLLSNPQYLAPG